jgi:hypothetical protein
MEKVLLPEKCIQKIIDCLLKPSEIHADIQFVSTEDRLQVLVLINNHFKISKKIYDYLAGKVMECIGKSKSYKPYDWFLEHIIPYTSLPVRVMILDHATTYGTTKDSDALHEALRGKIKCQPSCSRAVRKTFA